MVSAGLIPWFPSCKEVVASHLTLGSKSHSRCICSKSLRRSKTTTSHRQGKKSHRQGKKGDLEVWRPSIGHLLMKIPASTKMSTCIYETSTMAQLAHADWQIFFNKPSCWCLRMQKHTVLLLSVLDRSSIP